MDGQAPTAKHQFLTIGRYHRNERDAEAMLLALLKPRFPRRSKSNLLQDKFTFDLGKGPFHRTFAELQREVRETGTLDQLRKMLQGDDDFFPQAIDIATNGGMLVKSTYAGHEQTFAGPMRVGSVENELTEDILFYRRAACEASSSTSFRRVTRYYRAYVLACTGLVEAFLNRPMLVFEQLGQHTDAIEQLRRPSNFEARVELWVETFCQQPLSVLKETPGWGHFQELRGDRNHLVHALKPQLGVEIKALAHGFNLARAGVGGFLRTLRSMQGLGPTGFIERLESAPRVEFQIEPGAGGRRGSG
jgi:hypothetical protein